MKYEVYGTASVAVTVTVEADSKEEAIEKAYDEFGGLTGYAGNVAMSGKLVGTSSRNVHVEACDDDANFTEAEPRD